MIPDSEQGYAIDRISGVVHRRYASCGEGHPRTRSRSGITAYTLEPKPCPTCFPALPELASYYCDQCGRGHYEGSVMYERHQPEIDVLDSELHLRYRDGAEVEASDPEPYFPRPYSED